MQDENDYGYKGNEIDLETDYCNESKYKMYIVSVLGRDEGYTVKYNPLPEGVLEGEARGIS